MREQPRDAEPIPAESPSRTGSLLPLLIEPMLPVTAETPFDSPAHIFEILWDGVRALLFIEAGGVRVQDRYGRDISEHFPELQGAARQVRGRWIALDGEIVALDEAGRPVLASLLERLQARNGDEIASLAGTTPVTFQAFDILFRDGKPVMEYSLRRRKTLLQQVVRIQGPITLSDFVAREGIAFFEAARLHDLEGIVAKEHDSRYIPGRRSRAWTKIGVYRKDEFVIGGFTYGGAWKGKKLPKRPPPFASLLLGLYDETGSLRYAGEVSGPFAGDSAQRLTDALDGLVDSGCPFRETPAIDRLVFWCRPGMAATVRYAEWTPHGQLRFPVFEALRPDVPPNTCRLGEI